MLPHEDALLSVADVAMLLGVPPKTIYEWNSKGTGPRRLKVGKHIRYRRSDVESWIETRYVEEQP